MGGVIFKTYSQGRPSFLHFFWGGRVKIKNFGRDHGTPEFIWEW